MLRINIVYWLAPVTLLTAVGASLVAHTTLNVVHRRTYVGMLAAYLILWHFLIADGFLWWTLYALPSRT